MPGGASDVYALRPVCFRSSLTHLAHGIAFLRIRVKYTAFHSVFRPSTSSSVFKRGVSAALTNFTMNPTVIFLIVASFVVAEVRII